MPTPLRDTLVAGGPARGGSRVASWPCCVRRARAGARRPDRSRRLHAAGARAPRRQLEEAAAVHPRRARADPADRPEPRADLGRAARLHLVSSATASSSAARSRSTASTVGEAERRKYEDGLSAARQGSATARGAPPAVPTDATRDLGQPDSSGPSAPVRLLGVLSPLQVRRGQVRARRARNARRPRRRCASSTTPRASSPPAALDRSQAVRHRQGEGGRTGADDEQGVARHALDRADGCSRSSSTPSTTSRSTSCRRRGSSTSTTCRHR